jgi:hypothetical protein
MKSVILFLLTIVLVTIICPYKAMAEGESRVCGTADCTGRANPPFEGATGYDSTSPECIPVETAAYCHYYPTVDESDPNFSTYMSQGSMTNYIYHDGSWVDQGTTLTPFSNCYENDGPEGVF